MTKLAKIIISITVSFIAFCIGVAISLTAGLFTIAMCILPVLFGLVALIILNLIFKIFKIKWLLIIAGVIIALSTFTGAGLFALFA